MLTYYSNEFIDHNQHQYLVENHYFFTLYRTCRLLNDPDESNSRNLK